jgi:hypothetical protein
MPVNLQDILSKRLASCPKPNGADVGIQSSNPSDVLGVGTFDRLHDEVKSEHQAAGKQALEADAPRTVG